MSENLPDFDAALRKKHWTEYYSDGFILRSVVQSIPHIGTVLDNVLAAPGQHYKEARITRLFKYMHQALERLDESAVKKEWLESEEFYDLLMHAIDSSIKSRSQEKILLNSMILTNTLTVPNEDGRFRPEEYLRAIEDLSPLELKVLMEWYKLYRDVPYKDDQNDLQYVQQRDWRSHLMYTCGLDPEDVKFVAKRLDRTGFIAEVTGAFWDYAGGEFTPTRAFRRFMEYLSLNPLADVV